MAPARPLLAFNQEKALVGAFSVIGDCENFVDLRVQLYCILNIPQQSARCSCSGDSYRSGEQQTQSGACVCSGPGRNQGTRILSWKI